jgi:tyrosyl-tRNA synthetase
VVTRFHGLAAAGRATEAFEQRFGQKQIPADLPVRVVGVAADGYPIANLLKDLGLTSSTSESLRMIEQGGVRIDGEKVSDQRLRVRPGPTCVIQVGKRKISKVQLTRLES